jgi:enoyl-CoA hydratase/carnithine racemase
MNADVLSKKVADGIAVITLGSAKRIYFDEEMGDALTEALDRFAGDANVRVVVAARANRPSRRRLHVCRRLGP